MPWKDPPLPKYYQLAQVLSHQIAAGDLKPNDQLPTEEELCQIYNMSRGTVREAIRLLNEEGLIRRERGRGTFVTALQPPSTLFSLAPFSETMRRQNRTPTTQVLAAVATPATPETAERLALAVGEAVIHIVRLRLADNQPVVHETRYLAQWLCPSLLDEDLEHSSIHSLLVFKYQIPLVKMTHTVEAGRLSVAQATLLQAQPGDNAFFVDRLTYTEGQDGRSPAVWFQGIYRQDHYDIRAKLQPSL